MGMETVIHIQWEGPYKIKEIKDLNNDWDYGVYQIYGCHTVYGSNVLLYIGRAVDQTFSKRIRQEGWLNNQDSDRVEIYVGRLSGGNKPDDETWSRQICDVESLLIYAHSPATNSMSVYSVPEHKVIHTHVLNWGNFRDLLPEVSGHRWTSLHNSIPDYKPYGQ